MVYVGFGFLYTYLKNHTFSSVVINFICSAFTFQFSILTQAFFEICFEKESEWENYRLKMKDMIEGDFGAATFLISYGAVLGKVTYPQLIIMCFFESIFYALNYRLGEMKLEVTDVGGSMFIHSFGAFFGIACVWVLNYKDGNKIKNNNNGSTRISNTIAFIGTIFLWMFWPSFNTALITSGDQRYRGIINTIFSMTGSCLGTLIMSYIIKNGKIDAEDILNASVSGGVIIGGSCNLILKPFASIVVGFVGGIISTLGFEFIGKLLSSKLNLYDQAGILYLHGIPGLLGSIVTSICVACMTYERWNTKLIPISDTRYEVIPKLAERSIGKQAGYQFLVEVITLGISLLGGVCTAVFMKFSFCGQNKEYFNDNEYIFEEIEDEHNPLNINSRLDYKNQPKDVELENQN